MAPPSTPPTPCRPPATPPGLGNFPPELVGRVLAFLPVPALLAMSECSRRTHLLVTRSDLWRERWVQATDHPPPHYYHDWQALMTYWAVCPRMYRSAHPGIRTFILRTIPTTCKPTLNFALVGACSEPALLLQSLYSGSLASTAAPALPRRSGLTWHQFEVLHLRLNFAAIPAPAVPPSGPAPAPNARSSPGRPAPPPGPRRLRGSNLRAVYPAIAECDAGLIVVDVSQPQPSPPSREVLSPGELEHCRAAALTPMGIAMAFIICPPHGLQARFAQTVDLLRRQLLAAGVPLGRCHALVRPGAGMAGPAFLPVALRPDNPKPPGRGSAPDAIRLSSPFRDLLALPPPRRPLQRPFRMLVSSVHRVGGPDHPSVVVGGVVRSGMARVGELVTLDGTTQPSRRIQHMEGFHTAQCVAVAGDSVALQLDGDALGAAVRAGHIVRAAADTVPFPDVVLVGLRFQEPAVVGPDMSCRLFCQGRSVCCRIVLVLCRWPAASAPAKTARPFWFPTTRIWQPGDRAVLGLAPREPLPLPLFERPRPPPPIPVLLKAGRLAGVGRVLRTAFAGPDLCAVLLSYLAVVDPDVVLAVCRLNLAVLRLPWQVFQRHLLAAWALPRPAAPPPLGCFKPLDISFLC
eukprot:EG_transcript_5007